MCLQNIVSCIYMPVCLDTLEIVLRDTFLSQCLLEVLLFLHQGKVVNACIHEVFIICVA